MFQFHFSSSSAIHIHIHISLLSFNTYITVQFKKKTSIQWILEVPKIQYQLTIFRWVCQRHHWIPYPVVVVIQPLVIWIRHQHLELDQDLYFQFGTNPVSIIIITLVIVMKWPQALQEIVLIPPLLPFLVLLSIHFRNHHRNHLLLECQHLHLFRFQIMTW